MKREHIGSDFAGFLQEDGLLAECEAGALKRVGAWQIENAAAPPAQTRLAQLPPHKATASTPKACPTCSTTPPAKSLPAPSSASARGRDSQAKVEKLVNPLPARLEELTELEEE